MDSNPSSSPELPLPSVETAPGQSGGEVAVAAPTPERQTGSVEGPGSGNQQAAAQQVIAQDQAQATSALQTALHGDPAALTTTAATTNNDVDVIEKEWVARAKAIVDSTRNDPNLQSKELSKFKAEYLKHRFNKDMKLSDEAK